MRKLFRDLFVREGYQYDYVYDWSIQPRERVEHPSRGLAAPATQDEAAQKATGAGQAPRRKVLPADQLASADSPVRAPMVSSANDYARAMPSTSAMLPESAPMSPSAMPGSSTAQPMYMASQPANEAEWR